MRTCTTVFVAWAVAGLLVGCGPSLSELHMQGVRAYRQGDLARAQAMFEAVLEKDPERAETLYFLGRCYHTLARRKFRDHNTPGALRAVEEAIFYYNQAIEAFPGYQAALEDKNRALELKGQYEQALQVAEWAKRYAGPAAERHIFLAKELLERGDYDGALDYLQQAVAMEPRNAKAHAELGRFYMLMGQNRKAVAELQRAYELNPAEPGVVRDLRRLGATPKPPLDLGTAEQP